MPSLNSLEKEIMKFEKKGFKIAQKRTLKSGSRSYLSKKNGIFTNDEGVCIYYIDG